MEGGFCSWKLVPSSALTQFLETSETHPVTVPTVLHFQVKQVVLWDSLQRCWLFKKRKELALNTQILLGRVPF